MVLPRTKLSKKEQDVLETFSQDAKWFVGNLNALRKKYDGGFIAIKAKEVIAHDADLGKLVKKLESNGEKPEDLFIESTDTLKGNIILQLPREPQRRKFLLDIRLQGESELKEMITGSPGKWEYTPAGKKYILETKLLSSSRRL